MADFTPMTEDELISILRKEEQSSQSYQDSTLGAIREKAQDYYDRQPYGDEQEGSSQVVTSEFQDVIESVMPGLMDVFCGTDNPVQFTAGQPGEEKWEDEATEYVPHVLMNENNGFTIISTLLKDALMSRLSGAAVDLEDDQKTRTIPVEGMPQSVIDELVAEATAQPGAELVMELVPDPLPEPAVPPEEMPPEQAMGMPGQMMAPPPVQTFSGTITITRKFKRVVVDTIAPEDIRFTPSARSEDKASFLGYVKRSTSSEIVQILMDQGIAHDEALAIVDNMRSERPISTEEALRTDGAIVTEIERDTIGDSERPLWIVVAFVKADANGDGISEMLRVVYAHAGGTVGKIIDQVEWKEEAAIALGTPILMPHRIDGRCLFDQTQDLQLISSVLTRGMLNNIYLTNNPRPVVSDQVNLDSLLDWTPGSPVRLKAGAKVSDGHVNWLQVPSIAGQAQAALEYFATVRENRTGIVRNTQGIEGQTLQNKTLGGLDRLMGAAQRRQDLIAQTFAQTQIKRLYLLIYRAIKRAATGPISYRVGKAMWATCDPTQWPDDMSATVDEGTGTGGREAAVAKLGMVAQTQEKLIALQGGKTEGPYVFADNIANTAQALVDKLGYKTPGRFFQPPAKVKQLAEQRAAQTQQPQMTPEMMAAQAQIEIMKQAAEADIAIKREKAAADAQTAREKAQADIAIAEFKARQWAEIERYKAGLKADLATRNADHQASLDALGIARDANRPPPPPNGSMPQ